MKIVKYTQDDKKDSQPGVLTDDEKEIHGTSTDSISELLRKTLEEDIGSEEVTDGSVTKRENTTVYAPIPKECRLFCLGGVYTGHLEDAGLSMMIDPNQWVVPSNAIIGPEEPIVLPESVAEKVMPAAELCIVVGKSGKYIDPSEAYEYIAGYTVSNDVTARTDWPGPMAYKMMDSFSPVGPFIRTADEVTDLTNLEIKIHQGQDEICNGSTSSMRFSLSFMLSYISTITHLHPGDIISTGDPGGVKSSLTPGTTVEIEVEDVATLANRVELEE